MKKLVQVVLIALISTMNLSLFAMISTKEQQQVQVLDDMENTFTNLLMQSSLRAEPDDLLERYVSIITNDRFRNRRPMPDRHDALLERIMNELERRKPATSVAQPPKPAARPLPPTSVLKSTPQVTSAACPVAAAAQVISPTQPAAQLSPAALQDSANRIRALAQAGKMEQEEALMALWGQEDLSNLSKDELEAYDPVITMYRIETGQEDAFQDLIDRIHAELHTRLMAPDLSLPMGAPVGIVNEKGSCFMNSVIQCVYALPEYRQAIRSGNYTNSSTIALVNLIRAMDASRGSTRIPVTPGQVCERPLRPLGVRQEGQDAADHYLGILVDQIAEQNAVAAALLNIRDTKGNMHQMLSNIPVGETLYASLALLNATQDIQAQTTSRYVLLGLGRLGYGAGGKLAFNDQACTFPLNNFEIASKHYRLVGCVLHVGGALESVSYGHYTALVRHANNWYYADDTKIRLVAPEEMDHIAATGQYGNYLPTIFFYEQIG